MKWYTWVILVVIALLAIYGTYGAFRLRKVKVDATAKTVSYAA